MNIITHGLINLELLQLWNITLNLILIEPIKFCNSKIVRLGVY